LFLAARAAPPARTRARIEFRERTVLRSIRGKVASRRNSRFPAFAKDRLLLAQQSGRRPGTPEMSAVMTRIPAARLLNWPRGIQ